jgi:hypothetical protein
LPLDRAVFLSGTFGELRTGHFHAGLDIKSIDRKSGENVSAAADGYISRIKVSPSGYGNALYIAHPNGYTTVYAHLDRFITPVAEYVKNKQYSLKRFDVNLYLKRGQFQFKKGELIGQMGNSGSSSGPHLHFEIRRTEGQIPINPFHFGLHVIDKVPPSINKLQVYYLSEQLDQIKLKEYTVRSTSSGNYTLSDTLLEGAWRTGFALKTTDQMDGVSNRNGIYALDMRVDNKTRYRFAMDEIPFSKTRYINAHIDYAAKQNKKGSFHRCFKIPGNKLGIYTSQNKNGVVKLFSNRAQKITIAVEDINGNSSTLTFYIKRDTAMYQLKQIASAFSTNDIGELHINKPNFDCEINKGALYSPANIDYSEETLQAGSIAGSYNIGSADIPLHKYMSISIKPKYINNALASKYFIARLDDNDMISYGGKFDNGFLKASVREFGEYTVGIDTIPPVIKPVQFNANMRGASRMRFTIADNIKTGGKADGLSYNAYVDGDWILMEYDAKRDMLTHRFDGRIERGEHELILKVTDDRGNIATFQKVFAN